eukprot:270282-Alexandrium_andersonii.AAC.1
MLVERQAPGVVAPGSLPACLRDSMVALPVLVHARDHESAAPGPLGLALNSLQRAGLCVDSAWCLYFPGMPLLNLMLDSWNVVARLLAGAFLDSAVAVVASTR